MAFHAQNVRAFSDWSTNLFMVWENSLSPPARFVMNCQRFSISFFLEVLAHSRKTSLSDASNCRTQSLARSRRRCCSSTIRAATFAVTVVAAAGAAVGGAIGYSLDQQAADLRASMANNRIQIDNRGDYLLVTMPEGILFATDSAAVRADLQADIRALARNLQEYRDSTVEVVGHTDNTGSAEYNQDLSARRASAVAGILLEQGVAPSRVRSIGRGEDQPVATNLTPEGRAQNRRVEIFIRPNA